MTADTSIGRRTLVFTAARVAGTGSILVLFVLLSHLLAAPEYGTFRQVWLVNKGLLDVLALGVPLSVYYFVPRLSDDHKRRFVAQSLLVLAGLGLVLAAGVFIGAPVLARTFNNPEIEPLLRLFALYPLFAMPVSGLESVLLSLGRSAQYWVFRIVDRVALVADVLLAEPSLLTAAPNGRGQGLIEVSGHATIVQPHAFNRQGLYSGACQFAGLRRVYGEASVRPRGGRVARRSGVDGIPLALRRHRADRTQGRTSCQV